MKSGMNKSNETAAVGEKCCVYDLTADKVVIKL